MRAWLCMMAWTVLAATACADDPTYQGKTVKEWAQALKHRDARVRFQALAALHEAGKDAAPVAADIARLLKDPLAVIRRHAVSVLSGIEGDDIPPMLGRALRDSDGVVRQLAAHGLSEFGAKAQPVLTEALGDKDVNVRLLALAALDQLEGANKELVQTLSGALKDSALSVRRAAVFVLARRATDDPEARTFVARALRDKDRAIRAAAAEALAGAGKEVVEELLAAAQESEPATRALALQALGAIGEDAGDDAVAAFAKGLADVDPRVRQAAAAGMGQLKGRARAVAGPGLPKELAGLLQDKEAAVRRAAVYALGSLGARDAVELARIAEALKDRDVLVRGLTIEALGRCADVDAMEEIARQALAQVATGLRDSDPRVQNLAAQVLTREEKRAVAVLIPLVEKGQGKQRLWAAIILGEIGAAAADAVPALQQMSLDDNPRVRQAALAALQKIRE